MAGATGSAHAAGWPHLLWYCTDDAAKQTKQLIAPFPWPRDAAAYCARMPAKHPHELFSCSQLHNARCNVKPCLLLLGMLLAPAVPDQCLHHQHELYGSGPHLCCGARPAGYN